jgi:hypothetical protein
MEVTPAHAVIGAVLTLLGGFLGKGVDWLLARGKVRIEEKKTDAEVEAGAFDRAAALQREIIADLRKDLARLLDLLHQLEEERLACRVENATLKAELAALKERVNGLAARAAA